MKYIWFKAILYKSYLVYNSIFFEDVIEFIDKFCMLCLFVHQVFKLSIENSEKTFSFHYMNRITFHLFLQKGIPFALSTFLFQKKYFLRSYWKIIKNFIKVMSIVQKQLIFSSFYTSSMFVHRLVQKEKNKNIKSLP